jgi:putative glutathione S-transferase
MLLDGKWQGRWHPYQSNDDKGRFERQVSGFRNWVTEDGAPGLTGQGGFKAEAGRYHLYSALICPWACRTLTARALLGLEDVISVSVAAPVLTDEGWAFGGYEGATKDDINGAAFVHQLYSKAAGTYSGRATVPILWDKKAGTIVNNESADILRVLSTGFSEFKTCDINLYPAEYQQEIDQLADYLYEKLNNGVYRAGFAKSQQAYEDAVSDVFAALDKVEGRLSDGRAFLVSESVTEADIRLFVTLVRFDAAYHGLFKCNIRRIADYPYLHSYMARITALPGVANTVNLDHIKAGYYSIKALNPSGIVPVGPAL